MPEMNREEIAKLEALYASNPEGRVFTHLAEAYRKAGEFERARNILEQGLTKHPAYASAHVVLGRVYADLNDTEQAAASFRHVLELDPHNLVALRSLGDLARGQGRTDEALRYFAELRHQDPSNAEIESIIAELREAPPAPAAPVDDETSHFEEVAVPSTEPASESPEPEPLAAEAGGMDTLPGFEDAAPDYGDLVPPDVDLGWSAPQETEETLPGDLAEFAAMVEVTEVIITPEPEPEMSEPESDAPAFDLSDLEHIEESPAVSSTEDPWTMSMDAAEPEAEPEPEPELEPVFEPEPMSEPQAAYEPEPEPEPEPAPEEPDVPVVTETMAELYTEQGLFDQAASVYRALMAERPWDPDLPIRMADAEARARGETPSRPEKEEEVDSPWMGASVGGASTPTPYAWTEDQQSDASESGPPISGYFRSLLSWRPGQATAPAEEPAVLELDMPVEPEPWEAPAPAAPPAAAAPSSPQSGNENPVEAAFDEWFNASEFGEEAALAPDAGEAAPADVETPDAQGEDDDDLEMFRSWLQSLKK